MHADDHRAALQARTQALLDQRWAELEERLPALQELAIAVMKGGPVTDPALARTALMLVIAELYARRGRRPPD